ncbi:enoyl-CoA hydratase/isomerase family protein [Ammoniphilus sp. 3BR4]|uniref:enoyl-CoA hydratase/isomerase family protein n=1 Tax=Ammoniphilus sp. 3BR4 TaxID=3158265 RepID=UPI003466CE24
MQVLIKRVEDGKITFQQTSKIAIVTLNRSASRNALKAGMWKELAEIGKQISQSNKIKVVILRGTAGQFTAGSDIKEFSAMSLGDADAAFQMMEEAISAFENLSIPVIGAIDGPAMGAGFVLSLACDLRIGTANTRMGIPVGRLGITLGPSFMRRIVREIGPSRAKELVYIGKIYHAEEAYQIGLLNQLVENDHLDRTVLNLAHTIMRQSTASLKAAKKAVELCEWRPEIPWSYVDPTDFPEGCLAFTEKRKPKFK